MNLNKITLVITLASVAGIFGAIAYNGEKVQEALEVEKRSGVQASAPAPAVAIVNVTADNYLASVTGHGEALPRYQLALSSEVSGQVVKLSNAFASGGQVKQGDTLAYIDDTGYREALANAQVSVADAKLALLEEERQVAQANLEWQRSGVEGQPASPLVLRQPQLAAAKAKLTQAIRQLESAKQDLSKTQIVAPFDALIVSTAVQPGSYVQAGTKLGDLYSTDRIEVTIPLSANEWENLPAASDINELQWPVTLTDSNGINQWQGIVGRVEHHFNNASRQRSLVVVVDKPLSLATPLLPGTFLQAKIQGRELNNIWELPASAISQSGEIWMVDGEHKLTRHTARKVFEQDKKVYIQPAEKFAKGTVVVRPLNSYVEGTFVAPKTETLIGSRSYSQDIKPITQVAQNSSEETR